MAVPPKLSLIDEYKKYQVRTKREHQIDKLATEEDLTFLLSRQLATAGTTTTTHTTYCGHSEPLDYKITVSIHWMIPGSGWIMFHNWLCSACHTEYLHNQLIRIQRKQHEEALRVLKMLVATVDKKELEELVISKPVEV